METNEYVRLESTKDAQQYVVTCISLYRHKLSEQFGTNAYIE